MITYNDKIFSSWEEIVNQYPIMWVIFDKAKMSRGRVVEGHIMAILPDEEVIEFRNKNFGKVKLALRTSESIRVTDVDGNIIGYGSNLGGYIHGELINA